MAFLNTKAVLDRASTKWQDQTASLREKALGWLNEIIRDLHNQPRKWQFLEETITLAISSSQITIPAGAEIVYLKTDDFFFTPANQLTDAEANEIGTSSVTTIVPDGYTLSAGGVVVFYPAASGNVELKYEINATADLPDSDADTIYPKDLENLFVTGVRMHYYDYDKDGRYGKEVALYENEMYKIKAWDNRKKATTKQSPRAYTRSTK